MRTLHASSIHTLLLITALMSLSGAVGAQNPPAVPPSDESICPDTLWLDVDDLSGATAAFARAARVAGEPYATYGLLRRPSDEVETALCGGFATLWQERLDPSEPGTGRADITVQVRPLRLDNTINTGYARDRNNGGMWSGRGLSTGLTGGVLVRWGPLSAGLHPLIVFQQNLAFDIAPLPGDADRLSPWAYAGHPGNIDWPQRFGDGSYVTADLGQSFVRLDLYGLTAGLSHENLWWGPAREYPLMISNTSPGFPHLFFGARQPLDIWIGHLETRTIVGQLRESSYFEDRVGNDYRILAGASVAFHPRVLEGLSLGFAGLYSVHQGETEHFLPGLIGLVNTSGNGFASLFARWTLPASAFSTYVEVGRNDHWLNLADLLSQPEHAWAFTLGLEKGFPVGEDRLHLYGELARLQRSSSFRSHRGFPTFYTHGSVVQGHTHRGQLVGPAIGPGSNGLIVGADLFTARGRIGIMAERVDYHKDAYYDTYLRRRGRPDGDGRDLEHVLGVRQLLFVRSFDLEWGLSWARRRNRHFIGVERNEQPERIESNLGLQLRASWRPDW